MVPHLTICTFKWSQPNFRTKFTAEHVNKLFRAIRRNTYASFTPVCITDDPAGIDKDIKIVPLWSDHRHVVSPHGHSYPSCYRRLKLFSPEAASIVGGNRIISIDLDAVIVADMTPLWDRTEDFIMYSSARAGRNNRQFYNGSMFMLTAGARPQVWTEFDPKVSPSRQKTSGAWGSDQGWISHILGPNETIWDKADGVYSYRRDLVRLKRPSPTAKVPLPENARVVFWHGTIKPWDPRAMAIDWVRDHYG